MPLTAVKPQVAQIPPDVAAVLGDARIHPELLRAPSHPAPPTAATLTRAALAFATIAAAELREHVDPLPLGARGIIHSVGKGGVLHLEPSSAPRAISLVRGSLAQRGSQRPSLQPGAVRLLPAGNALTLADLTGEGALAVEVLV